MLARNPVERESPVAGQAGRGLPGGGSWRMLDSTLGGSRAALACSPVGRSWAGHMLSCSRRGGRDAA